MPVLDALAATRELLGPERDQRDRPRVLMLTTFDADHYVYEALRAGASRFRLKGSSPDELATAVRIDAAGDALLAPGITQRLIERSVEAAPSGPANHPLHACVLLCCRQAHLSDPAVRTRDLGGPATTTQFTEAVVSARQHRGRRDRPRWAGDVRARSSPTCGEPPPTFLRIAASGPSSRTFVPAALASRRSGTRVPRRRTGR